MHIKVKRQDFLAGIKIVDKAVKENKIRPIISCVYIKTESDKLHFCGTNLETTIKTTIDISEVKIHGNLAFAPELIAEYLREINDEYIEIILENENLMKIETENSETEFAVFNGKDFPNSFAEIKLEDKNLKFEMDSEKLISIFQKVSFAADVPDNIAMNCIRVENTDKKLFFVSTDTYRLVYHKGDSNIENNFSVSIPLEAISCLIKIIKPEKNENISVYQDLGHLFFKYRDIILVSKLIELRFPDYRGILSNSSYDKILKIDSGKLNNLLKRILVFARGNNDAKNSATYDFNLDKLKIFAMNEVARLDETVDVDFKGENLKISLNIRYLLDFVQNIEKDKNVILEFMNYNTAIKVYEEDNEDYIYLLMPLALKEK